MAPEKIVIAFDLYGTLLSTESIAEILAKHFGGPASQQIAAQWRRYQLEYTWRITCMGLYRDFSKITRASLHHALAEKGLSLSEKDEDGLIQAYDTLHVFPEIGKALKDVQSNGTIEAFIFSNGTLGRVQASIQQSPDLAPYEKLFKGLVTVEDTHAFKPAMSVYDHLVKAVGREGKAGEIWLVTANPFDAVGAKVAGLQAVWIDRAGHGWIDRLGDVIGDVRPTLVVKSVDEAVAEILQKSSME